MANPSKVSRRGERFRTGPDIQEQIIALHSAGMQRKDIARHVNRSISAVRTVIINHKHVKIFNVDERRCWIAA